MALPFGVLAPGEAAEGRVYLRPVSAGIEVIVRRGRVGRAEVAPEAAVRAWAETEGAPVAGHVGALLARIRAPRPAFAGLPLDRPLVMGIVNVTPDSFSDGSDAFATAAAVARGRALVDAGADIIDIGGESTRPGADPVAEADELARVLPVIETLAGAGAVVSVDTRRAGVMAAALAAGAAIVNDVTALAGEPGSARIAAGARGVVLMHMRGEPRTMQADPRYDDAALDVYDFLATRVAAAEAAGIGRDRIAVDPGIGFGKTVAHNVAILGRISLYLGLGTAVLVGASRKTFIGRLSREEGPKDRLGGSIAAALAAVSGGAHIVRVHDVAETRQALALWRAIAGDEETDGGGPPP